MPIVRHNIIANAAGSGWALLVSLAAVPFYIRFLGIEGYGLIGFFLSLTAIFSLLDLGLRATLNRKLAQLSVQPDSAQEMRDLLRTLEIIYWTIGVAIGLSMALLAPLVAAYWIKPQQISMETSARALTMMGLVIACQWPLALYSGGMMGLQKQVILNVIAASFATVRSLGAVLVLWQIAPTLDAFLTWFIIMSLAETLLTGCLLWHRLPRASARAAFSRRQLAGLWRFAAGMTGISVMSVILTQLDKVILSGVLSLEAFGYYTLAWRVAAALYALSSPINAAFFPRFSQLAVDGDKQELVRLYHRGCQLVSSALLPIAVVLALYAQDFLYLWTTDLKIAINSGPVLSLLALGTALNGLMGLPAALQFAYGWTRLVFIFNAIAVVLLAPMIYLMSLRYGVVGAAWVWLVLNAAYVLLMLRIMHRRLMPGELRAWFLVDTGAPLAAAIAAAGLWKLAVDTPIAYSAMLLNLVGVSLVTALAAMLAAPQVRILGMHYALKRPRTETQP
jgi:O-antigen/teichoic acid export membrane protein